VSLATVSRVVNQQGDVREDLVVRVREAVEMLGYRRDLTASTLRRSDRVSASIGLIFDDVANPFFSLLHRAIEDVSRARGVLAFAGSSDEDPQRERELAEGFAARGVDGLVIAPCDPDQGYLQRDRDAGTALVFVDRPPRVIDADAVTCDNAGGTIAGIEHLIAAGHRRIAFLGDRPSVYTAAQRAQAYRDTLARHDIEPDPALERVGLSDIALAEAAVRELLALPDPPTAIFTGQNLITVGAVRVLHDLGRHHEIALVGFDDIMLADMVQPGITVVRQDPQLLGQRAAELLFQRLDGYDGPSRHEVLPVELVPRGSGELPPA
jgi:LacI family transcriptional regulator